NGDRKDAINIVAGMRAEGRHRTREGDEVYIAMRQVGWKDAGDMPHFSTGGKAQALTCNTAVRRTSKTARGGNTAHSSVAIDYLAAACGARGAVARAIGPICSTFNRAATEADASKEATQLRTNTSNTRTDKLRSFDRENVGDISEQPLERKPIEH